jgi:hypothetical protein
VSLLTFSASHRPPASGPPTALDSVGGPVDARVCRYRPPGYGLLAAKRPPQPLPAEAGVTKPEEGQASARPGGESPYTPGPGDGS